MHKTSSFININSNKTLIACSHEQCSERYTSDPDAEVTYTEHKDNELNTCFTAAGQSISLIRFVYSYNYNSLDSNTRL